MICFRSQRFAGALRGPPISASGPFSNAIRRRQSVCDPIDHAARHVGRVTSRPSQVAPLPLLFDFVVEPANDQLAEMMRSDVEGAGDAARFLITQEGAQLTATHGNQHVPPEARTNRYLDDAIGPERHARPAVLSRPALRTPSKWLRPPSISNRDRQDSRQRSDATGQQRQQRQQVYRALSREPAEKRPSPGHFAQELPRPQTSLRHVPSRHSRAIRDSSHLEPQIDSGLQEHFNAYARPRGSHIADDIIEPDGRNWF
jgi:hypothetical protein